MSIPLKAFPINYIISVHIDNLEHWLNTNGASFENEWHRFLINEYNVNFNFRNNVFNLMNTYGEDLVKDYISIRFKKSA